LNPSHTISPRKNLEVLFTPADFAALRQHDLNDATCIVFDVFRATSSMITALANGAKAVIPASEISEALEIKRKMQDVLLAGERDGLRITAAVSGGVEFDLGNSPREFVRERVSDRTIVTTTTNGTRALRACAHARTILISSFLNLQATANAVQRERPGTLLIICSGTFEQTAYEDVLAAGALCELIWNDFEGRASDAAFMARKLFQSAAGDLLKAASESRNGRRLLANADLRDDVAFCMQRDVWNFTAALQKDGRITRG
jgi:2-phosphosulfolactate phosphatase